MSNNNLTAIAKDNMVRVSPQKLSLVVNSIVNKNVNTAVNQLKFSQKRISKNVLKVLNAAIANAENNKQLDIIYGKIYKKLKKGKQEIQNSQYYKKLYNKFV